MQPVLGCMLAHGGPSVMQRDRGDKVLPLAFVFFCGTNAQSFGQLNQLS